MDEIKRLLDVMAFYKLNIFLWYLSNNEGWRVEIKKYPELIKTGGTGDRSNRDKVMFYTQEQIKDIVEYAKNRCNTIITEIDVP